MHTRYHADEGTAERRWLTKALVVYDSVFGNTEKVAKVMAEALGCEARRVGEVKPGDIAGLSLLVVGSPTRAFRPMPTVSAFVRRLPGGSLKGVRVAGFDTRIGEDQMPGFLKLLVRALGYAARPIVGGLVKRGATQAAPAEGFFVSGSEGPLKEGEMERARAWAVRLALVQGSHRV
jgi:flavodoxin